MTNKKIVRIQSGDDFIDIQNNIKYELEVQSHLVMNNIYWDNYYDFMLSKHHKSNLHLQTIKRWLQKMKEQNSLASTFPQIDFLATQSIGRDIFSSNLIPQHLNALDLSAYISYTPDVVATQVGNDIQFNQELLSNKTLKPKPLNKKEFKILRVLDDNHQLFIDLKIRNFSEKQIITEILSLPLFWRNYHLISRTRVVDNFHENIDYKLNSHLLQFYNPAVDYLLEPTPINKIITYNKEHTTRWRQITSTNNGFNFMQLANQLMFTQPGLILPLTYRETRWSSMEAPDYTVKVSNKEANLISMKIKGNNTDEENYAFFMECIERINVEDRDTIYKLAPNKNIGNGQYILAKDGNVIYVYEQNILDVFQMLSLYDNQNNIQD